MTFEQFDIHMEQLFARMVEMRDTKGKEYAHSKNRFANFDRLANELGVDRKLILFVYLKKHLDSITSFIMDNKVYLTESIHGRILDAMVYLSLLDGMINEEENAKVKCSQP